MGGSEIRPQVWMGGSPPRPLKEVKGEEREYIRDLFLNYIKVWEEFWGVKCPRDVRKKFFNWARYDAHATFRGG